jgi:hypothetical protein
MGEGVLVDGEGRSWSSLFLPIIGSGVDRTVGRYAMLSAIDTHHACHHNSSSRRISYGRKDDKRRATTRREIPTALHMLVKNITADWRTAWTALNIQSLPAAMFWIGHVDYIDRIRPCRWRQTS